MTKQSLLWSENQEYDFFEEVLFPSTRYQGSKAKITDWIWDNIKTCHFHTVLDAFGGTGCVSHLLKRKGKKVHYNDYLTFNYLTGKALVENNEVILENNEINELLNKKSSFQGTIIQNLFNNIFYLNEENIWLDNMVCNILEINDEYKQAIAWFALFQSCLIKRPYNLFHRANLNVRTKDIKRSFGNKISWDAPFEGYFKKFANEANKAIFNNGTTCAAYNYDIMNYPFTDYDLVYIDPPYVSGQGVGTDYIDFYHFLEGMVNYRNWESQISRKYKHKPLNGKGINPWINKKTIYSSFEDLIRKFKNSTLVISYRSDGIPSEKEIYEMLKSYYQNVRIVKSKIYKYALSRNNSREILFITE